MFSLVYLGSEVGSHRKLLEQSGVQDVGFSFHRAQKRGLPTTKTFMLADRYPDDMRIWVHPGINSADPAEVLEFAAAYEAMIVDNIDRITSVVEIDSPTMGLDWVKEQRRTFYNNLPEEKFLPVWRPEYGLPALDALADQYPRIGIPGEALEDVTTLAVRVNAIINRQGTEFHALAMAKPDNLRSVRFTSASTMAWLAPMLRGETVVWDGTRLVRYPKAQKDQARTRHRMLWDRNGFDANAILADDHNEVARATVWAYQQLEKSVDKRRGDNPFTVIQGEGGKKDSEQKLPANSDEGLPTTYAETGLEHADNRGVSMRNAPEPREPHEQAVLPVFAVEMKESEGPDGATQTPLLRSSNATLRNCDSCFVSANCPAYKPNTVCAFNLPVEIKTKEQLKAVLDATLEMQAARVAFARFSEEINGGYPDPNVSSEIDRLYKMVKTRKEIEEEREYARITVERSGGLGALSNFFGSQAKQLGELPGGGLDADQTNNVIKGQLE